MTAKDIEKAERLSLREYQNKIGPTAEQSFQKYGSWEGVIEGATSSNRLVDVFFGILRF